LSFTKSLSLGPPEVIFQILCEVCEQHALFFGERILRRETRTSEKFFGDHPCRRVIFEVFSPLPLLSLVSVFDGLVTNLVQVHWALDVLAYRILLDNWRVVSLWAEIGPKLELILLLLMVV
jgi:hypothetical protein